MAAVLIIFAKEPVPGQVKTRLTCRLGPQAAAELYRQFLVDVLAEMQTLTGIHLALAFTPPAAQRAFARMAPGIELLPQGPGDLGARLAAASAWGFSRGFKAVMIRNSDSPDLPATVVAEAAGRLLGGELDLILGPSPDGGYYLVGLTAPAPALFADIPWSTTAVLECTLARARQLARRATLLAPWPDIDTLEDLKAYAQKPLPKGAPGWRSHLLAHRLLAAD
jgi:hypothetical protein